nr:prolyl oligopeptidase family protein [Tanacetum cinerariifolium]
MDEQATRLLLKEQTDAFTTQLAALHVELQAVKVQGHLRHGAGGDQGSMIMRSMRFDVPKFNGADPESWIFSINKYFELLERPTNQRLKEQTDAFTTQLAALHVELQAVKVQGHLRHGAGGDQGSMIMRSMRFDVPKFNGADPESWIFSINKYFELLERPTNQRLKVMGFNLEGDATEWFRWMTRNKLVTSWDNF